MSYVQPIYRNRDDVTISPATPTKLQFQRRDRLPENQEVLWQIESGVARSITWSQEGELVCLGYWGAGDVVGHALSRVQPYEIHCLTNVEVSRWNRNQWAQLTDAIVHHQQQTEELLSIIHINPISQKLWQLLAKLATVNGQKQPITPPPTCPL